MNSQTTSMSKILMLTHENISILFKRVWALSMLFQTLSTLFWVNHLIGAHSFSAVGIVELTLLFLSLGLFLKPSWTPLLFLTCATQLLDVVLCLPDCPNHRIFTGLANLVILLALVIKGTFRKKFENIDYFQLYAPAIRIQLILLYIFAALGKLNWHYLDPQVSCASKFYLETVAWLPILPTGPLASHAIIWGSLLCECLIPLGLLIPRFRGITIVLGSIFHLGLSFNLERHFQDFSSLIFACYILFLSPKDVIRLPRYLSPGKLAAPLKSDWAVVFIFLLYVLGVLLAFPHMPATAVALQLKQLIWLGFSCIYILALWRMRTWASRGVQEVAGTLNVHTCILLLGPLLVLLNGLGPYLGLKNKSSWDMYSNLRIEGGTSNHLIIGPSLDVNGSSKDIVKILDSSDPWLRDSIKGKGYALHWFEFQDYLARNGETSVFFERAGKQEFFARAKASPVFAQPASWFSRKLIWYRPLDLSEKVRCGR